MFFNKIYKTIVLIIFSSFAALANSQPKVYDLVNRAIEVSPSLKMLSSKLEASKNSVAINSNLPDPTLRLGLINLPVNSFSFSQEPMTGKMISLSQGIPFPGKLGSLEERNLVYVDIVRAMIDEEKNRITNAVKQAYYDFSFFVKSLQIAENKQLLLKNILEVVQTKYEVSEASQQNVLSVDLSITNLADKIEELTSKRNIAHEKLKSLILSSEDIYTLDDLLSHTDSINYDYRVIEQIAKASRPLLKQIHFLEEKAKRTGDAAEYDFYPNFNLTLQYSQRDRLAVSNTNLNDFLSVIVGLNIPINYGGKISSKVAEAKSMQDLYRNQYQSNLQLIRIQVETSLAKLRSLHEREKIIKDIKMTQSFETYNSSLAGYQVGAVDFINVIRAVNDLLDIETDLYKVRKEYYQEKAILDFLAGKEL